MSGNTLNRIDMHGNFETATFSKRDDVRHIEERYSLDRVVEMWEELYMELLSRKSR